jgi:hypothetical protein
MCNQPHIYGTYKYFTGKLEKQKNVVLTDIQSSYHSENDGDEPFVSTYKNVRRYNSEVHSLHVTLLKFET